MPPPLRPDLSGSSCSPPLPLYSPEPLRALAVPSGCDRLRVVARPWPRLCVPRHARSLPCPRSPATSATRCFLALLPCCWDSCAATAQAGRCYFCYCSAVATAGARHRLLMLLRCRCCFAVLLPLLVTAAASGRTRRCCRDRPNSPLLVGPRPSVHARRDVLRPWLSRNASTRASNAHGHAMRAPVRA